MLFVACHFFVMLNNSFEPLNQYTMYIAYGIIDSLAQTKT